MALFDMAEQGITNLFDGDHDGAVLDDVFKFATGGVFDFVGGAVGGNAGKALGLIGKPLATAGEDYGDMMSDFFGTRGPISAGTTDEDYKQVFKDKGPNGELDGFGTKLRHEIGAGSQGGALAGGVAGAHFGSLMGPIGTVLGGMAGAGLGAVLPNLMSGPSEAPPAWGSAPPRLNLHDGPGLVGPPGPGIFPGSGLTER